MSGKKHCLQYKPERCEKCGKDIPPRYPLVEYDEYWCKGHTQPKRKRGRPRKNVSGFAPLRLREKLREK